MVSNSTFQNKVQNENAERPEFAWEAPKLYTEEWLNTLAGNYDFTSEEAIWRLPS